MVSPLLPLLLSTAYFGDFDRTPSRLLDQDFGVGLRPEQLLMSRYGYYLPSIYYRPWGDLLRQESSGGGISSITLDKDQGFKVTLDVQQFKPEEVEVKLVDKYIVVSAKHEEKKDEHGLISRQFVRRYVVPENVDIEKLGSTISSDGVLTIQAPLKDVPEDKNERKIKIEYTGKPALKHKDDSKEGTTTTTEDSTTTDSTTTESSKQ